MNFGDKIEFSIICALINLLMAIGIPSHAQFYLNEVEVCSTRILENRDLVKSEVNATPAMGIWTSHAQIFQALSLAGLDWTARGSGQAVNDFSINGANFQQNLVLLDGMRLANPQTAHFNLDLPDAVFNTNFCQIGIIPGNASSIYGSDAFGGILQFTIPDILRERQSLQASYGSHQTFRGDFHIQKITGYQQWHGALSFQRSAGYMANSDYENVGFFLKHQTLIQPGLSARNYLFFSDKRFGANNFYALYPSREATRSFFAANQMELRLRKNWWANSKIYVNRHTDHFVLIRDDPSVMDNRHTTTSLNGEFQLSNDRWSAGIFSSVEEIESNHLGDHRRWNLAFFSEYGRIINQRYFLHFGLREDIYPNEQIMSPQLGLACFPIPRLRLFVHAGRSFRNASFTELYYHSKSNIGNPDLKSESAWSFEQGIDWKSPSLEIRFYSFLRREDQLISWAQSPENDTQWQARNIERLIVWGQQFSLDLQVFTSAQLGCGFWWYHYRTDHITDLIEKYFRPQYQLAFNLNQKLTPFWGYSVAFYYKKNYSMSEYSLLNSGMIFEIGEWWVQLAVDNILNTNYESIRYLPAPSREMLLKVGIEL